MPVPDYQTLLRPLLAYGQDGGEKNIREAIKVLSDELQLTERERSQQIPSGKQALIENRVHWARTYLDKAGAIKKTRRSHFIITNRGQELLQKYPKRIDLSVLNQFLAPTGRRGAITNETNSQDAATSNECWLCKAKVAPTYIFCPHCGTRLMHEANGLKEAPKAQPPSISADIQAVSKSNQKSLLIKTIVGGTLLFLGGWLLALLGSDGGSDHANVSTPNLLAVRQVNPGISNNVKVTNVGNIPITIQSASLNGKEVKNQWSEQNCAGLVGSRIATLPETLAIGQSVVLMLLLSCGELIEATIHTDHGTATYNWK
jgi:Mrr N-terminal domain